MRRWIWGGLFLALLLLTAGGLYVEKRSGEFTVNAGVEAVAAKKKTEGQVITLTVPVIFESQIPEDFSKMEEAANEITRAAIGVEMDLIPVLRLVVSDSQRASEMALLKNQGIQFDLVHESLEEERLLRLNDLLPEYGSGILALFEENNLEFLDDEELYYLPSVSDYVAGQGIAMRKDIVDQYGIDISQLNSYQDFDELFQWLAPLEPELNMISSFFSQRTFFYRYYVDKIPNTVFAVYPSDPERVVNIYDTEEYRQNAEIFRDWYLNGYTYEFMGLQNISAYQLVESGTLFSYVCAYKPGIDYEASSNCKMPMVVAKIKDPVVTDSTLTMNCWGISADCPYPEKAMELLNLFYTNSDLMNLISYGIEGVHYQVQEDGTINWPEGMDKDTAGYYNDAAWIVPNQFLTHIWEGEDADLWEQLDAYNRSAVQSQTLGFVFDDSKVKAENDAVNAIADKYDYGLGTGQLDPDIYVDRMLKEMKEAGLELVYQEVCRQYDDCMGEQ